MGPLRIIIADDDAAMRAAQSEVLGADVRFTVVDEVDDGVEHGARLGGHEHGRVADRLDQLHRRVHRVVRTSDGGAPDTEDMRSALVEARALFDDLISTSGRDSDRHRAQEPATRDRSGHRPQLGFHRHQTKEG